MKLKNKLIPLLSVVASTGVVAPIAASCGVASLNMVDIVNGYKPSIAKAKEQDKPLTDVEAQDLYFTHLAANPEILKQDVLKYEADYLPTRIEYIEYYNPLTGGKASKQKYVTKNVVANVGIENISFKRVNYIKKTSGAAEESFFYALSCDLAYEFDFKAVSLDGTYEIDSYLKFRATLKDIPTLVYSENVFNPTKNDVERRWRITNDFTQSEVLSAIPGWSYTFDRTDYAEETIVDSEGKRTTTHTNNNKSGVINRQDQITNLLNSGSQAYYGEFLSFESYHLSDVAAPQEDIGLSLNTVNGVINAEVVKPDGTESQPFYALKPFNLFNISDKLAEKLTTGNKDSKMFFTGALSEEIPQTGEELTGKYSEDILHKDVNAIAADSATGKPSMSFDYCGPYDMDWSSKTSEGIQLTYPIKANLDDIQAKIDQGKVSMNSLFTILPYFDGWSEDDYKFASYQNISTTFALNDTFNDFICIPADTYIGYAYYDNDNEEFVCKTILIPEQVNFKITVVNE